MQQPVPAEPNRRPAALAMFNVLDLLSVEAYRAGMTGEDRASPGVEVCRAVVEAMLTGNNDPVWVADAAAAHIDDPAAYAAAAMIRSFLR
ncbi:MAG: hypothetical protein WC565_03520 [Parcubacteria group bacterium]